MTKEFVIVQPNPLFDAVNRPNMPYQHDFIYKADKMEVNERGDLILKRDESGDMVVSLIMQSGYWITCLEKFCIKQPPVAPPPTQGV
jgi:hypothetical protein